MEAINSFTFAVNQRNYDGEYESPPLVSELLLYGNVTGKKIPGYCLEAQYQCGSNYLFITSWDCPFEESCTVTFTNENLDLIDVKSIGGMYLSIWLKHHEVVAENQLLLHFDYDCELTFRVTIDGGLTLEEQLESTYRPYFGFCDRLDYYATPKKSKTTKWWKFWRDRS